MSLNELPHRVYPETQQPPPSRPPVGAVKAAKTEVVQRGKFAAFPNTITSSNLQVIKDRPNRNYLLIQNNGSSDMFLNFGSKADTFMVKIFKNGGVYEPLVVPTNSIHLVCASGEETQAIVIEGLE